MPTLHRCSMGCMDLQRTMKPSPVVEGMGCSKQVLACSMDQGNQRRPALPLQPKRLPCTRRSNHVNETSLLSLVEVRGKSRRFPSLVVQRKLSKRQGCPCPRIQRRRASIADVIRSTTPPRVCRLRGRAIGWCAMTLPNPARRPFAVPSFRRNLHALPPKRRDDKLSKSPKPR